MLGIQTRLPVRNAPDLVRIGHEHRSEIPVDALWRDAMSLYRTGLHPAVALCIRHRGRVILDRTVGHVDHRPGETPTQVASPDTLFNLFSASKVVTATLVHALVEDGLLSLDDRVCDHLPGFEKHGKQGIRIHHLLSHTAGISHMPSGVDLYDALARGRFPVERLYDLVPTSSPGATAAYHPMSAWFLIDEIIQRVTGTDLRTACRDRLLAPLGFEGLSYGVAQDDVPRVARHTYTGPPTPGFMGRIFERTIGTDVDTAIGLSNHPSFLTGILPSANVIGTGREATRFLHMLNSGGIVDGVRVLDERTVARATSEATAVQLDGTFGFPIRYGLGYMMGGDRFSLFGLRTRSAFGHLGFTNVVVYADPTRDLCVSFLNTGKPMLAPGMLRWYWVLQRIASAVPRA